MEENFAIKNDLLAIAYYMKKNGWEGISKTNFQRVLYFSAVLSTVFLRNYEWTYAFSNTIFGPRNKDITGELEDLFTKGYLELSDRKVISNRVEEKYVISDMGCDSLEETSFRLNSERSKLKWFEIMVNVLSVYGEEFLSKLVKEDPNVSLMNSMNQSGKIPCADTDDNLTKELYNYLKKRVGEIN
uniref:hypothetical protein n=1 Tax=Clostridium sp. NkU-1 TaxID=1095009 RepID=UPI000AF14438